MKPPSLFHLEHNRGKRSPGKQQKRLFATHPCVQADSNAISNQNDSESSVGEQEPTMTHSE